MVLRSSPVLVTRESEIQSSLRLYRECWLCDHLIARRLTRSDPRWFRSSKPRSQRRGCAGVTGRRATIDKQLARSEKPAKPRLL